MNFYLDLTEEEAETAAVTFTWTVEDVLNTVTVDMKDAEKKSCGYKAACPIAVAEMTYPITATLTIGDEEVESDVYSAKQYANVILTDESFRTKYIAEKGETKYNQLLLLVKTMLSYGAKAQLQFSRSTDNLADAGVDYTPEEVTLDMIDAGASDMTAGLSAFGLEYTGSTVVFLSKTSLRHYYRITEPTAFDEVADTILFNGEQVGYETKGKEIYFELKDIEAPNLDARYILNINGTEYSYSALDYVKGCLSSASIDAKMKALAAATYLYNQAADAYFGQ